MRRREFIGGVFWSAVAVRLANGASQDLNQTALFALAETIIPDKDPTVWKSGEVVDKFRTEIDGLNETQRSNIRIALGILGSSSIQKGRPDFAGFPTNIRKKVVAELLDADPKFKTGFAAVRTAALKAFYLSKVGWQRTGYRDTTQFVGFPEYVKTGVTLE